MGEKAARDKVTKRKGKMEWNGEADQGPLAKKAGLYLDIDAGILEFLVTRRSDYLARIVLRS